MIDSDSRSKSIKRNSNSQRGFHFPVLDLAKLLIASKFHWQCVFEKQA